MKFSPTLAAILALFALSACRNAQEQHHEEHHHSVIVTSPEEKDVTVTERYVCQIHSRRHIEVRALEGGYLEEIPVKEGQTVSQGDLMFKLLPTLYQAKRDSESAEAQLAQIELENSKRLFQQKMVSDRDVALAQSKLNKALAQVQLAQAELNFTELKAPFDGIIDRLYEQQGSLIEEGDMLTTLSDNDVMWVYFNVPEANYLEYQARLNEQQDAVAQNAGGDGDLDDSDAKVDDDDDEQPLHIELELANGKKFDQPGRIVAVEADFNNKTGNIAFRADFPNPEALLRHGQTGTVLIHRELDDALVIPQRATFEILAKRYVYVVDKDDVVHQREIDVDHVLEDVFVIGGGLSADDKIVLEGVQQVRDGEKEEYEFREPKEVLSNLKNEAQ